jgi:hypothetical protein
MTKIDNEIQDRLNHPDPADSVPLKDYLKEQRRIDKHPTPKEWLERRVWWPLCRLKTKAFDIPDEIRWFIQRGRRGYSESDLWSLDWYLSNWMPKALREFKKSIRGKYGGVPSYFAADLAKNKKHFKDLTDEEWAKAKIEWLKVIDKMIAGFEASVKQESIRADKNHRKNWDRLEKTRLEGMGLFVKWFGGLWW